MSIGIGINGFGRMGRLGVRAAWDWQELDFVQVNEIACDAAGSAHLLKFDSVHGTWGRECEGAGGELRIDGRPLAYSSNQGIGGTDWSGYDLVVENGLAVRVPLLNASLTDFVFEAERPVSAEEINGHFRAAAEGELKGILGYEERPLVSVDYVNDPRSAIVDAPSTLVVDGTQIKVLAWYDNEWGYVNRMMELARKIAGGL